MDNRCFLYVPLLLLCGARVGFALAKPAWESPPVEATDFARSLQRFAAVEHEQSVANERANPNCMEWKNQACTVCGIDSVIDISVKNKRKTPILLCRNMKPGPARVVMSAHVEPSTPGPWEVEFGLGYETATRDECPHQFIASNHPPLKSSYEVGPIMIEGEIPSDGMIQALACVGLSSARVGGEGKETGASLKIFKLRFVSK